MKKRKQAQIANLIKTEILSIDEHNLARGHVIVLDPDLSAGDICVCPVTQVHKDGGYVSKIDIFSPANSQIVSIQIPEWLDRPVYIPVDSNGKKLTCTEVLLASHVGQVSNAPVVSAPKLGSWNNPEVGKIYAFLRETTRGRKTFSVYAFSVTGTSVRHMSKTFSGITGMTRARVFAESIRLGGPSVFTPAAQEVPGPSYRRKQTAVNRANRILRDGGEFLFCV